METSKQSSVKEAADLLGGFASLARLIDVSVPTVHQWSTGIRRVPTDRAIQIEAATNGAVRAEDLRPDVPWHVIRNSRAA